MNVQDVQLHARSIRRLGGPKVEILMSPCFKVQAVVTVIQVGEFGDEGKLVLCVQLGVFGRQAGQLRLLPTSEGGCVAYLFWREVKGPQDPSRGDAFSG